MPMNRPIPYEEGTWTPVVAGATTAGTHTYTSQSGAYVRVGNMVTVWFNVFLNAKDAAAAGQARIAGLPYVSASGSVFHPGALIVGGATFPTGATQVGGSVGAGQSFISITGQGSGISTTPLDIATGLSNSSVLRGTFSYRIP